MFVHTMRGVRPKKRRFQRHVEATIFETGTEMAVGAIARYRFRAPSALLSLSCRGAAVQIAAILGTPEVWERG